MMRSAAFLTTLLIASPALAQLQPKMFPDTLPANATADAIYALHATSGGVTLPPNGAVRVNFDTFAGFTVLDATVRAHPGGCNGNLTRNGNEITVTYPNGCAWGFGARLTMGVNVQTSINSGRTSIVTTFVDGAQVSIAEQVLIFGVVDFAVGPAGPMGPEGPQGAAGADGTTVTSAPEAAGANCPQGGVRIEDADGATFVCNGPAGPAGPEGPMGPMGSRGPEGPAGPAGAMGTMGEAGSGCSATGAQDSLLAPLLLLGALGLHRRRAARRGGR